MKDILEFYVSGFWTWLGITAGLGVTLQGVALIVAAVRGQWPS